MPLSLAEQLSALSVDERPRKRAEWIKAAVDKVAALGSYSWEAEGHQITVSDVKLTEAGAIMMTVALDGKVLPEPANPFVFVNPPLAIRDAEGRKTESPLAAAKAMVTNVVLRVVR